MNRKSQAGLEYLFLIGALLTAVIIMFVLTTRETDISVRTTQTRESVKTIADAADRIYRMGGGKTYVTINVPDGVNGFKIQNNTILYQLKVGDQTGDAFEMTLGNVTGTLPTESGIYKISVEMLANGTILIGGVDTTPPIIIGTYPSGTIPDTKPSLKVFTNENAVCRFCASTSCNSNTDYTAMPYAMTGSGTSHNYTVGPLSEGSYLYYARCNDTAGNVMTNSGTIQFTVSFSAPDTTPPIVLYTRTNSTRVFANENICVNATATDNIALDKVWARVTDPNGVKTNYTMSDTGACAGTAGDSVFGVSINLNTVGNYTINTTFANDTSRNIGWENPYPNIRVEVLSAYNLTYCRLKYPAACLKLSDVGIDQGWYFTSVSGDTAKDSSSSLSDITSALLDDTVTTPPSSQAISWNTPSSFNGYIAKLNNESSIFSQVVMYVRVDQVAVSPYGIRIYAYKSDGDNVNSNSYQDYNVTSDILTQKVKWLMLDVTNLTVSENGFGFVRLRVTASTATQKSKNLHFSEIHYLVGV